MDDTAPTPPISRAVDPVVSAEFALQSAEGELVERPTILALRPYQEEALRAIEGAAGYGVQRPLVVLPTGSGKTIVFSQLAEGRAGRTLILAHRDELIQQAAAKYEMVNTGADIGIVQARRDEHEAPTVIASVQTLSRVHRLGRIHPDFTTVIVDEAHHATAPTYRSILESVGSFTEDGPLTVGFTATPERGDGTGLNDVWEAIVYSKTLPDLIRDGYLCDLRAVQVRLEADFAQLHTRAGDFIAGEVEELLEAANAPEHVVSAYREHADGRKALAFTPTVDVAYELAEAFCEHGIKAEALDGRTPADERRDILARFRSGETRIVANCAVLTEGFDEPSIECIIVARPTKSRPFYQQMIGRGSRTFPTKTDCLILDVVGATTRHDLTTAATLFGLEPQEIAQRGVGEIVAEREATQERLEKRGKLVARAVDLFARNDLAWTAAESGRFVLSTGQSLIALSRDGDGWTVRELVQGEPGRTLASRLDMGYALGVAEDRARQLGAERLVRRDAPWRGKPASEQQIAALGKWRIPPQPGLTAGAASELLQAAIAGARR